jgi:ABC-type phosphate/phosphonate transport system substrate-binding protein
MICGLPFSQLRPQPTLIGAPRPSPARYEGRAQYFTDIVVATTSRHQTLADTFGGVIGYTVADSMSGAVALRHHLRPCRTPERPRLYRAAVGNLVHARGVIEALVDGRIDVGPLDSYSHDLLRRNDAAFAAQVRTVASTQGWPIPPIVATAMVEPESLARLRAALQATEDAAELAAPMARLLLAGFAFPDPAEYDVLAAVARDTSTSIESL